MVRPRRLTRVLNRADTIFLLVTVGAARRLA
jgi:hypothetical protein